jgi:hypothetical protein
MLSVMFGAWSDDHREATVMSPIKALPPPKRAEDDPRRGWFRRSAVRECSDA